MITLCWSECDECFPLWSFSERSLSPSDTELSSPELAVCHDLHGTAEENDVNEDEEQEISENGQEVLYLQTVTVLILSYTKLITPNLSGN